jgi:hypothetical protein
MRLLGCGKVNAALAKEPTMAQRPCLVTATPCFGGQVSTVYANGLMNLQRECGARGIDFEWLMLGGDALITRARADLVAHFLDRPDATHLLFIDADIGFAPEQVFRLFDFDAEMTASAYPTKTIDWARVRRVIEAGRAKPEAAALRYVLDVDNPEHIMTRRGFAKVRYAGTGFLMIRRAALERLCAAHPELRYRHVSRSDDPLQASPNRFALFDCLIEPGTGLYLSEDYAFCRRWTELGGEIWVDLESRLIHVGPMEFNGDLATQFDPVAA